jgi:hypothetical protein
LQVKECALLKDISVEITCKCREVEVVLKWAAKKVTCKRRKNVLKNFKPLALFFEISIKI